MSAAMAALFNAHLQAEAGLVESSDRLVGNERIGTVDECQMVAQVLSGFGEVHWRAAPDH